MGNAPGAKPIASAGLLNEVFDHEFIGRVRSYSPVKQKIKCVFPQIFWFKK